MLVLASQQLTFTSSSLTPLAPAEGNACGPLPTGLRNIPRRSTNTATFAVSSVVHRHRGYLSVRLEVTPWPDPAVAAPPAAAVAALFRCNRRERREGRNLGGEQGGTWTERACVAGQRVEAKGESHGG